MKLYYYAHSNFGDALNPFLWERILPGFLDEDGRTLFVGIGTLLNNEVPKNAQKLVFGTGAGYGAWLPRLDAHWTIYWVRGPLTARALGLDDTAFITDGASLLPTLDLGPVHRSQKIAFMPHWRSTAFWNWKNVCDAVGLTYIDPCAPVPRVLTAIREANLLITEALHGAIVADAFRVPWVAVRAYRTILESKWLDWCGSLGVEYAPVSLFPLYSSQSVIEKYKRMGRILAQPVRMVNPFLEMRVKHTLHNIMKKSEPRLSEENNLARAIARMQEQLERFRREYAKT